MKPKVDVNGYAVTIAGVWNGCWLVIKGDKRPFRARNCVKLKRLKVAHDALPAGAGALTAQAQLPENDLLAVKRGRV